MNKTIGPGNFNTTTVIMLFYAQKPGQETQAATSYNYPTHPELGLQLVRTKSLTLARPKLQLVGTNSMSLGPDLGTTS